MPNQTAPLDVIRVRAGVRGTRFADVRYVAQTASTNADAQRLLGSLDARGATIVAEYQTAGVGRKGRRWIAPGGSALLFTSILPEPVAVPALWAVPFWIALAVADAVEHAAAVRLDLVWPNDLFAHARKIGGILSVARVSGEAAWVGCGVGLDVLRPGGDPELDALDPPPVFLNELAPDVSREAVLTAILRTFDSTFELLSDPDAVANAWEARAGLRGTPYRYRRDSDGIERAGIAQRIGAHGTLIVHDEDGEVAIDMADVRVVKPDR
ncbi:MAG: hypothetical protein NVS2B17_19980 [Candidatus Velthaea sp.]